MSGHYNPGSVAVSREQLGMVKGSQDKFGTNFDKAGTQTSAGDDKVDFSGKRAGKIPSAAPQEALGYKNGGMVKKSAKPC